MILSQKKLKDENWTGFYRLFFKNRITLQQTRKTCVHSFLFQHCNHNKTIIKRFTSGVHKLHRHSQYNHSPMNLVTEIKSRDYSVGKEESRKYVNVYTPIKIPIQNYSLKKNTRCLKDIPLPQNPPSPPGHV